MATIMALPAAMLAHDKITEIFRITDDFCKGFSKRPKNTLICRIEQRVFSPMIFFDYR
jgi:hypothetical protein